MTTPYQDQLARCIARTFSSRLLSSSAYQVPDARNAIKLDAMESPYQLPIACRQALAAAVTAIPLNRYPSATHEEAKVAVRAFFQLHSKDIDILFGNGSDELIQLLIAAQIGASGRAVMAPAPSFVMYARLADNLGVPFISVPLQADFSLDVDAMLAQLDNRDVGVIFIAQPNNPTGNLFSRATLEAIIQATDALVVLDEAYFAFHNEDYLPLLTYYPNLIIMRTFSKIGLAGLRFGCILAHRDWIMQLNKLRLPYNINSIALVFMTYILSTQQDSINAQIAALIGERERLIQKMRTMHEVTVFPSAANFVTIRLLPAQAGVWYKNFRQAGILVKNLDGSHPQLIDCLRVTVGTHSECERFMEQANIQAALSAAVAGEC